MRVYQTLTIFGFRHARVAEARIERSPNGKGVFDHIWFYEPEDWTGGPQIRKHYRAELDPGELDEIMNEADKKWIEYWSVETGQLTDWAKADIEQRG